jgi:uncharacterized OB-fold protein
MPKPLSLADQESREFWEGVKAHQLRLQRCLACRRFRFYPRALCPHCPEYEWVPALGGTVYSYTVCHRPPGEAFAADVPADVPYVVVLVDLAEGVRLLSNLIDCPAERLRVGLPVEVVFEDASPEIALDKFRPAAS